MDNNIFDFGKSELTHDAIISWIINGFNYKETAAKLGISIATVNTLLVNALKKIRQAYPDITQNIILFLLLSDKKR